MTAHSEELLSEVQHSYANISYPTLTYAVSDIDILRFSIATNEQSPAHTSIAFARAQGWSGLKAPPSFYLVPRAVWSLTTSPDAPLLSDGRPQSELLPKGASHAMAGETTVSFGADIFGGDLLSMSRRVIGAESKQGRSGSLVLVQFETIATNESGETVFEERYTRILR